MREEEVGPVVEVAVQKIRVCNKTKESKIKKVLPVAEGSSGEVKVCVRRKGGNSVRFRAGITFWRGLCSVCCGSLLCKGLQNST